MIRTISNKTIRAITGAKVSEFKAWLKAGLAEHEVEPMQYDARGFYVWYKTNVYRPMLSKTTCKTEDGIDIDLDVQRHRSRYERARADKYSIRANKLRAKYVTDLEAKDALYELASILGGILEQLPTSISETIYGKEEDDMLMGIDLVVREILTVHSKEGGCDGGIH